MNIQFYSLSNCYVWFRLWFNNLIWTFWGFNLFSFALWLDNLILNLVRFLVYIIFSKICFDDTLSLHLDELLRQLVIRHRRVHVLLGGCISLEWLLCHHISKPRRLRLLIDFITIQLISTVLLMLNPHRSNVTPVLRNGYQVFVLISE